MRQALSDQILKLLVVRLGGLRAKDIDSTRSRLLLEMGLSELDTGAVGLSELLRVRGQSRCVQGSEA